MKTYTVEEIAKMGENLLDFLIENGFTYHQSKISGKHFWRDREYNEYTSEKLFRMFCKIEA